MQHFFKRIISGLLISAFFLMCGCQNKPTPSETATGFYFNTVISVTVYDSPTISLPAKELADNCLKMAEHYEQQFSRTVEGSDIWNVNHSNCTPVTVSDDTIALLTIALSYAESSAGLVDPTIGSLSSLWNFSDADKKTVPSHDEIEKALSHVDYKAIQIDGNQVILSDPDACIDLGFIAKGYVADRMKEYLQSEGVTSAIINLGGNVQTIGNKPDGSPYKVGIQEPFAPTGTALLALSITDKSVVSSGNYERCFTVENMLYHHILSTADGYPVANDLSQVTIISSSSADGDALSTLCYILGYEEGRKLIESLPDTKAVFVTTNGEVIKTF